MNDEIFFSPEEVRLMEECSRFDDIVSSQADVVLTDGAAGEGARRGRESLPPAFDRDLSRRLAEVIKTNRREAGLPPFPPFGRLLTAATKHAHRIENTPGTPHQRLLRTAPWVIAVVSTVLTSIGLHVNFQNHAVGDVSLDPVAPLVALVFPWVGAIIASRRPSNPIGWLFCASTFAGTAFFAEQYATFSVGADAGALPGASWMAWVSTWGWVPGLYLPMTLAVLLFPDGRSPTRSWKPILWAVGVVMAGSTVVMAVSPGQMDRFSWDNPFGHQLPPASRTVAGLAPVVMAWVCVAGLWTRHQLGGQVQRAQLKWIARAVTVAVVAPLLAIPLGRGQVPLAAYHVLSAASLLFVAVSVLQAMVQHRLYGLRPGEVIRLADHSLVAIGLAAILAFGYWIAIRTAHITPLVMLVALALAGALRRPLNRRVESLHLAFRAHVVFHELGDRLRSSMLGPDKVLPAVVEVLADAVEVPYLAVEVNDRDGHVIATYPQGRPGSAGEVIELVYQDEVVGWLTVGWSNPDHHLDRADGRLLEELAGYVAVAVSAVGPTLSQHEGTDPFVPAFHLGRTTYERKSRVVSLLRPGRPESGTGAKSGGPRRFHRR